MSELALIHWNKRKCGDTSYEYVKEGKRLKLSQNYGTDTADNWLDFGGCKGHKVWIVNSTGYCYYFSMPQ